jgi:hypothetical protein
MDGPTGQRRKKLTKATKPKKSSETADMGENGPEVCENRSAVTRDDEQDDANRTDKEDRLNS